MKKFLSYLSSLGIICVLIALGLLLMAEGNLRLVYYRYLLFIGMIIQFPYNCYKMWHWEDYKNENRFNSVFIHVLLAALLILAMIIFEKKGL